LKLKKGQSELKIERWLLKTSWLRRRGRCKRIWNTKSYYKTRRCRKTYPRRASSRSRRWENYNKKIRLLKNGRWSLNDRGKGSSTSKERKLSASRWRLKKLNKMRSRETLNVSRRS
jgi:hypothetical protein